MSPKVAQTFCSILDKRCFNYSVLANSGANSRTGTPTVAGSSLQVTQDGTSSTNSGCNYSLNTASESATSTGGSGQVTATAAVGPSWTATSNADRISIVAGANGNGAGSFTYSVQVNTTNARRNGTVTVGATSFSITQGGRHGRELRRRDFGGQ